MPNSETSWVKVQSYWDDEWGTPWPLSNLRVDLDKKLVADSMMVDHAKEGK
jgi:hypothetical protein